MTQSVWDSVVGQAKAVEQLHQLAVNHVHAYLFIGPEGCGKDEAARAFAAQLITGSDNATSREADLIMRGSFSDVIEVLREGAAVDKDEAEAIIRLATTTPTESKVKVVIVHEVHLMRDSAAARLLKTIEEPSEKVIFILLADQLVPSLATINSRCIVVQFAANNAYRERLLANDPQFAHRQEAFASIPYKLDGSGATVALIVDEIFELIEQATVPLIAEQKKELDELEARVSLTGPSTSIRAFVSMMVEVITRSSKPINILVRCHSMRVERPLDTSRPGVKILECIAGIAVLDQHDAFICHNKLHLGPRRNAEFLADILGDGDLAFDGEGGAHANS